MSKSQRSKGRRGELEALRLLAEYGIDGEIRYGQEERGGSLGDIESNVGNWEVKRRALLPDYLRPAEDVRGVLVRQDRGPWLVVLRATDALALIGSDLLHKALTQQPPACRVVSNPEDVA